MRSRRSRRIARLLTPLSSVLLLGASAMAAQQADMTPPVASNEFLISHDISAGGIDPTNVPVVAGDFKSLTASIAPTEATKLKATDAQKIANGTGVTVAVLDSGFNLKHPVWTGRLASKMADAFSNDGDPNDPGNGIDDDADGCVDFGVGHGNHVASLVARCAPSAKIMPIRIADDEGRGTSIALSTGLQRAIEAGVRVINVSFHLDQNSPLTSAWLSTAESNNIVVVCAAGNEGLADVDFFAKAATTFAVGAVDGTDKRASFSNYGNGVDIFAPGVGVLGAFGKGSNVKSDAYWSGTSFSSGFVAGAAALVVQRHPTWTASQIRAALKTSIDPAYDTNGAVLPQGRINLLKAAQK